MTTENEAQPLQNHARNIQQGNHQSKDVSWKFWKMRRYTVVFMIFLGLFSSFCNRVCLSVTIVAMTKKLNETLENGTVIENQHFDWNSKQQGMVLSSFYYGFICTQILGGILAAKFSGYYVLLCGIGGSSLMALLSPLAASSSIYLLMAVRIIEGLFEAVNLPAMHALISRWAPVYERSRMVSFCIMGGFSGTVITMTLSGVLASHLGWKSVFYYSGCFGMLWCILWIMFIRPSPDQDNFLSEEEAKYIANSIGNDSKKKIIHPWKKILTSTAVWAIVASNFADNWSFTTLLTQLPTFLSDVIKLEVETMGIVSALSFLARSIVLVIAGYLADWCQIKGYLSTRQVRKFTTCGGFIAICATLLLAAFLENPVLVVIFITLTSALGGLANVGYFINPLDLAPNHASVIFGISNTIATLGGIASPLLVGVIVTDKAKEQWQIVFLIIVAINLMGTIFYWFFAKGELQPWAVSLSSNSDRVAAVVTDTGVSLGSISKEEENPEKK